MRVIRERTTQFVCALVCAGGLMQAVADAQTSSGPGDAIAARVGTHVITTAELDAWWLAHDASTYRRMQREQYEGRQKALDALVGELVLSLRASAEQRPAAALLDEGVRRMTRPVTDEDVARVIGAGSVPPGADPRVVEGMVRTFLEQRERESARERYLASLRNSADVPVDIRLEMPRVRIATHPSSPVRGRDDAPVEVVVFSDFECPFCRRVEPALQRLLARFPSEIRLVWRHYPLSSHANAQPAAEAAQCAHDQGRFWEYHDALFADPTRLATPELVASAMRLGLDVPRFEACVRARTHTAMVARDREEGDQLGVTGTPTVFVNGRPLVGALEFEVYERAVVEALRAPRPHIDSADAGGSR